MPNDISVAIEQIKANVPLTLEGYVYDLYKNNDYVNFNLITTDCNMIKVYVANNINIDLDSLNIRKYIRLEGLLEIYFDSESSGSTPIIRVNATKYEVISSIEMPEVNATPKDIPDLYNVGLKRIAIITGKKNKGFNDLFSTAYKGIQNKLEKYPVPLQKKESIQEIADLIRKINDENKADLICIIRGGGEEAYIGYVFDSPVITEAIQNSNIPILTAIGHADNSTAADLVSDAPYLPCVESEELKRRYFTTPTDLGYFLNGKFREHYQFSKRQQDSTYNSSQIDEKIDQSGHQEERIENKRDYFLYFSYLVIIWIVIMLYQNGGFEYLTDSINSLFSTQIKPFVCAVAMVIGIILFFNFLPVIIGIGVLYLLFQVSYELFSASTK